jgi:hypothetical protein
VDSLLHERVRVWDISKYKRSLNKIWKAIGWPGGASWNKMRPNGNFDISLMLLMNFLFALGNSKN